MQFPEPLPERIQDAVIIGAGVVGCAVARECALRGMRVTVLEKGRDFLDGASKANSAILHTGFDAPIGSLEQRCIATGYDRYLTLAPRFGLVVERTGAMVVAWNGSELSALEAIRQKASDNGVTNTRQISKDALSRAIPGIGSAALGALHVPDESIIDPWSTPWAYLRQALDHGAVLLRNCALIEATRGQHDWTLTTDRGSLDARLVINCAGLHGDTVETILLGHSDFTIKPRKGQFVVYDKAARPHCPSIILPVPSERTKGIVVCPTVFGNVLVGPTAEEQDSRDRAEVNHDTLTKLKQRGDDILPSLADMLVTATYAGLRPATEVPEYRLFADSGRQYIRAGGIRSTGLSAALGIAAWVDDAINGIDGNWPSHSAAEVQYPEAPFLAESQTRDWQRSGNQGIVCHCEWVTRREIESALTGPLAATTPGGLKRRTRATMGRCQGFYCSAALAEITAGRIDPPFAE